VTVFRSPSSASGELRSGATPALEADPFSVEVATAAPAPFVSGVPHLPQKSDVDGFSALHCAQCFASAFPHFAQKLLAEGLLVPHFEQRICLPNRGLIRFLYHAHASKGIAASRQQRTGLYDAFSQQSPRLHLPQSCSTSLPAFNYRA